ncbi:MAG: hypothetical protein NTW14_09785 [bacterium]|nr:hypothetical protein [bacterium]
MQGRKIVKVTRKKNLVQICNHCGKSVAWGSGWFVNRVPDCNPLWVRQLHNFNYPEGDYICIECDESTSDNCKVEMRY